MAATEDEETVMQVPALGDDPELALLKESSSEMVETALRDSLRELDSETRLVLQQHLIDGLINLGRSRVKLSLRWFAVT